MVIPKYHRLAALCYYRYQRAVRRVLSLYQQKVNVQFGQLVSTERMILPVAIKCSNNRIYNFITKYLKPYVIV